MWLWLCRMQELRQDWAGDCYDIDSPVLSWWCPAQQLVFQVAIVCSGSTLHRLDRKKRFFLYGQLSIGAASPYSTGQILEQPVLLMLTLLWAGGWTRDLPRSLFICVTQSWPPWPGDSYRRACKVKQEAESCPFPCLSLCPSPSCRKSLYKKD